MRIVPFAIAWEKPVNIDVMSEQDFQSASQIKMIRHIDNNPTIRFQNSMDFAHQVQGINKMLEYVQTQHPVNASIADGQCPLEVALANIQSVGRSLGNCGFESFDARHF